MIRSRVLRFVPWSLVIAMLWSSCAKDIGETPEAGSAPFPLRLPPGTAAPSIPADDPFTVASVTLGKALFFEKGLSRNGNISCASCHHPDRAFSDSLAFSFGTDGHAGFRNAPTLANVAYRSEFLWDGGAPTLEQQVLVPLLDTAEMGADVDQVIALLKDREPFRSKAMEAYGRPFDLYVLTRALASFERTLISGWSRFDRFRDQNEIDALTAEEQEGWAIFNGERGGCSRCHSGSDLSDHSYRNIGLATDHAADPGRQRITLRPEDRGKFKVPTLRNIARTAPYMHDGSLLTLEEVVEHFNGGGLNDPNKSPLMAPLSLTPVEKQQLLAFLHSLNDEVQLDQVP